MMTSDVVILDVRTEEEFDDGHIRNAVLLPDYEISEKAESVLADKNQTILIYCRTGRRSAIAAKELISMGYTSVYDFGGIADWTDEIVWGVTDTVFYNYFGGDLPPTIVTSINVAVNRKINEQMPEFSFHVTGISEKEYRLNHDDSKYYLDGNNNRVEKITISDFDGNLIQEIGGLETAQHATKENMYGFSFDDWNFDGYTDISLWRFVGGTSHNSPTYYWLWDKELGKFVENEELIELSDSCSVGVDEKLGQVTAFVKCGAGEYFESFHEYKRGRFVTVKTIEQIYEGKVGDETKLIKRTIVSELVDAEMVVTRDYYEEEESVS